MQNRNGAEAAVDPPEAASTTAQSGRPTRSRAQGHPEPKASRDPAGIPADCRPIADLSDLELIDGIRESSEAHFTELYNRYFQRIYNFVYGKIRNHADAEEIAQETFTIVFSSIGKYQGRSSLVSWIYGIAKNTTNNLLRRAKAKAQHMQEAMPEQFHPTPSLSTCSPEEQLTIQRYLDTIEDELGDLGTWQVEIFEMRHLQNLSITEISERTGRSSDSIRSSLYRVKRLLMETAKSDPPLSRHSVDVAARDARQDMGR